MRLGVCLARGTHLTSSSTPYPTLILFLCVVIIAAGGHVDLNLAPSTVAAGL